MHKANMTAIRRLVERDDIAEMIRGKGVIEIGSYNVNGSARTAIEPVGPCFYMGIDSRPGPGVDVVGDICDAGGIPIVDVVACTDTLEHIEDWRAAVDGLNGILKPGGLLIFSVPMPGFPYHEFPHDFWRFTEDDLRGIFANCIILHVVKHPNNCILIFATKTDAPVPDLQAIDLYRVDPEKDK